MNEDLSFTELNQEEMWLVDGGGLAMAFVGAVFGGGFGLVVGCVSAIILTATGNSDDAGDVIFGCGRKGLVTGAWVGLRTPTP